MPKKKNKHYKPQAPAGSKGLVSTWQNGYNQGLCDGQMIMADICFVALNDVSGYGNSKPEKWQELEDQCNWYVQYLIKNINDGDPEMGFEKIVEGMHRARPDIAPEIEERYKKVLYNFKK